MAGLEAVQVYAEALDQIVGSALRAVSAPLRLYLASARDRKAQQALAESLIVPMRKARKEAYQAGVELIFDRASEDGVQVDRVPPMRGGYDAKRLAKAIAMTGTPETVTDAQLKGMVKRHVYAPARQVMQDMADPAPFDDDVHFLGDPKHFEPDPTKSDAENQLAKDLWAKAIDQAKRRPVGRKRFKFARVLRGEKDCGFCVMLASRGAVYDSPATAGAMDVFHDGCDCVVVVVFVEDDEAKAAHAEAYRVWKDAQEWAKSQQDEGGFTRSKRTQNDMLNNLRRYLLAHPGVTVPTLEHLA